MQQHRRKHAGAFDAFAGEGTVVNLLHTAGRASGLQYRKVYFMLLCHRKAFFRAVAEFFVFAFSGCIDNLAVYDFTGNTWHRQAACHFGTDGNDFMSFREGNYFLIKIVAAVVFAFLPEQARAD